MSDKNKIKNLSNDFTIKQNLYQTTTDKIKKNLNHWLHNKTIYWASSLITFT